MAFKIVKGNPIVDWFPVAQGATVYVGSIVELAAGDGVSCIGAASGGDVTPMFGIVIGTDAYPGNAVYNSTYNTEYITAVTTQAAVAARSPGFHGGMVPIGDKAVYVKVALLDRTCVVEGNIYETTSGTAPTVVTCTTASTDGLASMVHGALTVTTRAYYNMYYCRSGANRGIYRISYAASTTTPTFYIAWPEDWAVGDTFAVVHVGLGRTKIMFNTVSTCIENGLDLNTNYYVVDCLNMDLSVAGKEKAQFKIVY
jgi:hypothetical protein